MDPRLANKWWRLTHLYKIKDKQGNIVTFMPNTVQLKHLAERGSHRYNLIVKARQEGITTLYCIDDLDESLWVTGMTSAIIAHESGALEKIFQIVKRAYENFPDQLKPETKADNVREYEFKRRFDGVLLDSSIYVSLKIRSGTVQNLHITESAYIKNRQELIAGSKQAVPITGRISEESTGNGYEGFYDSYVIAKKKKIYGPMDYKPYFYAWFENPEYTLDGPPIAVKDKYEIWLQQTYPQHITEGKLLWRRWKKTELARENKGFGLTGDQLFKQEYPATWLEAFQSGAGNVFNLERLELMPEVAPKTREELYAEIELAWRDSPEMVTYHKGKIDDFLRRGVVFWELPIVGQQYVTGCDPSDGQGADFGPIDVWTRPREMEAKRQCAQFYGKLLPNDLAELNRDMAEYYNHAFVGIENNMLTTISHLVQIYDNYYQTTKIDEKTKVRSKKIGWNTNAKSREFMIDEFLIDFEEGDLVIRSGLTLTEMGTFIKKELPGGRYKREHADGKNDDALFAAMIANQMAKHKKPMASGYTKNAV